jgi:hypothetical protein
MEPELAAARSAATGAQQQAAGLAAQVTVLSAERDAARRDAAAAQAQAAQLAEQVNQLIAVVSRLGVSAAPAT